MDTLKTQDAAMEHGGLYLSVEVNFLVGAAHSWLMQMIFHTSEIRVQ